MGERIEKIGEGVMSSVDRAVTPLREKLDGHLSEEDRTWNRYLDGMESRTVMDFVEIVNDPDIEMAFKERAFDILLAPDLRELQHNKSFRNSRSYVYNHPAWTTDISEDQARIVSPRLSLAINSMSENLERISVKSELNDNDLEQLRKMKVYNRILLKVIKKLPEEEAEALFDRFSLFDLDVPAFASGGYISSLEEIFDKDLDVDKKFMDRIINEVHERILDEKALEKPEDGKSKSTAFRYANSLSSDAVLNDERKEFVKGEVEFLLSTVETDETLFPLHRTQQILELIEDPKLRHKFVRQQVLGSRGKFILFEVNEGNREFAKSLLEEFENIDLGITEALRDSIEKYDQKVKDQNERRESWERVSEEILLPLKKKKTSEEKLSS